MNHPELQPVSAAELVAVEGGGLLDRFVKAVVDFVKSRLPCTKMCT